MADIRTTMVLDDTAARAQENPLSYGGRWAEYGSWSGDLANLLIGSFNAITLSNQAPAVPQQSHYYWTPSTWSGDVEVWARAAQNLEDGASASLGMISSAGGYGASWDGYHLRINNTFAFFRWELWVVTNGSGSMVDTGVDPGVGFGDYVLFRRNGNDLEGWYSGDNAANWSMVISYTDTNYTTAMSVGCGFSVSLITSYPGWLYFGGGVNVNRPQFYRWIKN